MAGISSRCEWHLPAKWFLTCWFARKKFELRLKFGYYNTFGKSHVETNEINHFLIEYRIEKLGLQISRGLINLIDDVSGKDELVRKYDNQNAFFLEPVHGEDILEEAIEKLEPMFQRRIRAVEVNNFVEIMIDFNFKTYLFVDRKSPKELKSWQWIMNLTSNWNPAKCSSSTVKNGMTLRWYLTVLRCLAGRNLDNRLLSIQILRQFTYHFTHTKDVSECRFVCNRWI